MDRRPVSLRGRLQHTIAAAAVAALVLVAVAPASASAESFCGQARSLAFTLEAPASFQEPGLHRFEWREIYLDEEGNPVEEIVANAIETVPGTDLYTGQVLLRLASVWGMTADGDLVTDVQEMAPDQPARFFASVGYFRDDPFAGQNQLWVRWETGSGWTDWTSVPSGPERAFCPSFRADIFRHAYGWGS
jgi:hypothetical protein